MSVGAGGDASDSAAADGGLGGEFGTLLGDDVSVEGESNEWHAVWCETLRLVATLASAPSLRDNETFARELWQFVMAHRKSAADVRSC